MRRILLFLFVVCMFHGGFAQSRKKEQPVKIVVHQVKLGETVRMLSKKYLTDPSEIYRMNKFAVNGIAEGMYLQIPVPLKDDPKQNEAQYADVAGAASDTPEAVTESVPETSAVTVIDRSNQSDHTVASGETLSGLSKKYGVSIDEIKMSNEVLNTKGLKIGQVIKIPSTRKLAENESSIGSDVVPANEVASSSKTKNKK